MGNCYIKENKRNKNKKISKYSFKKYYPIGKGGFGRVTKIKLI
jgi:hypothetical protein